MISSAATARSTAAERHLAERQAGPVRGPDRRQRCRQEYDAARHFRTVVRGEGSFCSTATTSRAAPHSRSWRTGIAHCPEGRRVFPDMTVNENLDMGAYLRTDSAEIEADRERVYSIVSAAGRTSAAGRRARLSGGEQQMLAIGRAMMARPKLIMFDEPSLGLAPNIVERTFDIITGIREAGTTVLMVEQNAYSALEMCDHAYLLEIRIAGAFGPGPRIDRQPPRAQCLSRRLTARPWSPRGVSAAWAAGQPPRECGFPCGRGPHFILKSL